MTDRCASMDQPTSTITIRPGDRYFTLRVVGTKHSVRTDLPLDQQGNVVALGILSLLIQADVVEAVIDLNRRQVLSVVQGSSQSTMWTAEIHAGSEHYRLVQRHENGRNTVTIEPANLTTHDGVRLLCSCLGILAINADRTELDIALEISDLTASTVQTTHGGTN